MALVCQSCYNKHLPVCSQCRKQRKAYTYDDEQKPVCRICALEGTRTCKVCGEEFPAGVGRICTSCSSNNSLGRQIDFGQHALSPFMAEYFTQFSQWLVKRRGSQFASNKIKQYFPYFFDLDRFAEELERHPSYEELVDRFTVARTRQNLLVSIFLDEIGVIRIDKRVQEEYSNMDMIERYLGRFPKKTWQADMLHKYSEHLHTKLQNDQTTVRSIRLALGGAVNLLHYCRHFVPVELSNKALHGYLWKFPGQRGTLTGFVNFVNSGYSIDLQLPNAGKTILHTPTKSRQLLERLFLEALRSGEQDLSSVVKKTVLAIEYLHHVGIPDNVVIELRDIKRSKKDSSWSVRLAGREFYLPEEVTPAAK
ncbi:hypothetical protein LOH54_01080 [Sulfurimonas sp. HSL-3221]|uniref:hypothetical protein n=1 Tax=Sulfurimonadaceae TaxID=2771471 RepID=UPI001E2D1099|nr:hypothetical protein [Sulfurimonas sp. HSL-3221]UFS62736.1 hypothetical protein LOH54_01080 [Sulfurimonas sp. HSL-3221]